MPTIVCEQVQGVLSAQLDGEIQGREQELLEIHLQECAACRTLRDEWAGLDRDLRAAFAARQARIQTLAQRAQARVEASGRRRCTVLVVDDEPYILPTL